MKKLKNTKGITLMALVITIIILIILASIGTYSGIQVVKSAQFTAFSTELKIMQTQVNSLYEKKKNNEKILLNNVETEIEQIGTAISSDPEVQEQAENAFNASGITTEDIPNYKYFKTDTIKSLNIEGVEGEFFVNIDKRSVVSYDGFEYEGKTYYTLEQLPDGLYNVEHNTSEQQPDFNVDYDFLENGKCKISVNNINYNGNINKWQVKYKKENEEDWKQSNNYSFIIDELGNYRVKIANNNTESREKQIMAKALPSEFQEVEYIESTGTQYIDTGITLDSNSIGEIDFQITESGSYNIFGSRSSATENSFQAISSNRDGLLAADFQNYQINRLSEAPNFSRNIIKISNKYIEINDNKQIVQNYTEFETPYNSYIFNVSGNPAAGFNPAKMRLFSFKIWKNNNLVRYFIPCYQKLDKKPGLYDVVNDIFYTNQGTGDFKFEYYFPLPSEYQQVEYIESTGTQYIDTGIKCSQNMSCEIENNFNELSGIQLFGAYSSPKRTHYGIVDDRVYMPSVENSLTTEHIFYTNMNYHTFFLSSTVYKYDNEIIANGMFEFTNGLNFYLFARNNNENVTNYCKSKMTKAKFWIDNKLIKNFIPCYRKSDNKPGLYDLVNNEFYTNQGTGDFEKGDDVIASDNTNDGMIIIINNM